MELRPEPFRDRAPEAILLIHPGAMGDLIRAIPAFERIRARFRHDRLVLLVGEPFAGMARGWGLFDEIITLDLATAYHGGWLDRASLFVRLARTMRARRFSVVGVFKPSPVYAALARASGAPVRAGLTRGLGSALLTAPVVAPHTEHMETRYLAVARALGAEARADAPTAVWPSDPSALRRIGPSSHRLLIGIAPGGGNVKSDLDARRWPIERYAELCTRLLELDEHAHVLVLGAASEQPLGARLERSLPPERVTSLIGRTSVAGARDIIAACGVFVTNDSGLLHLAATTDTPIVAIFGPTSPAVFCPPRARIATVWEPARPKPCYDSLTGRMQRCATPCCIERCSVDAVHANVVAMLDAGATAPLS